jgi:hypothetical protein
MFLIAAAGFPLLVLMGYFKSYYFREFFDFKPLSVYAHVHGVVMSIWVLYFTAQTLLIRTKNVKLHMSLGMAGVALAGVVIITGMVAAYQAHLVRKSAPAGIDPYVFFMIPVADMTLFAIFFGTAIYYRKRPAEHKALMLLTAINFLSPALGRIPVVPPQYILLWIYGVPDVLALAGFAWYTWKHKKFNWVFAAGIALMIVSQPLRVVVAYSQTWHDLIAFVAPR